MHNDLPISASTVTSDELAMLEAVIDADRVHDGATLGMLANRTGMSIPAAYLRLRALRKLGLVSWEPGRLSTLRPLVAIVAVLS